MPWRERAGTPRAASDRRILGGGGSPQFEISARASAYRTLTSHFRISMTCLSLTAILRLVAGGAEIRRKQGFERRSAAPPAPPHFPWSPLDGSGASNRNTRRRNPGASGLKGLTEMAGWSIAPLIRKFAANRPSPSPPISRSPRIGTLPRALFKL